MDITSVLSTVHHTNTPPPMHRIAQGHMTHTFLSKVLPTVLQHDKKSVSSS